MDGFKNIEIRHFRGIEHSEIHDFWQTYEGELEKVWIPTKTPPTLTIPAKKTKIYGMEYKLRVLRTVCRWRMESLF